MLVKLSRFCTDFILKIHSLKCYYYFRAVFQPKIKYRGELFCRLRKTEIIFSIISRSY